jgi:general stress protein 26
MTTDRDQDDAKDLEELIGPGTFVMLMTTAAGEHSSRPITVVDRDRTALLFLVDRTVDWVRAIADGPGEAGQVHGTVSDNRTNTFLSFNGSASVSADRAEIDRLWNPGASAFFDGKDDPSIAVLRVDVSGGDYWDGPSGRLGQAITMIRALLGDPDDAGDHGAIDI